MESFCGGEASRGQFRCTNPDCRCDAFYRHGTYPRYFIDLGDVPDMEAETTLDAETIIGAIRSVSVHQVCILRVKCMGCGVTHAVLPVDAVPFQAWSLLLVFLLLLMLSLQNQSEINEKTSLHETSLFSWKFLKRLVSLFLLYRSSMISAIRFGELYQHACDPSCRELLLCFAGGPSPSFPSDAYLTFLKLFRSPLFVSRHNTISYPLRYLLPQAMFI